MPNRAPHRQLTPSRAEDTEGEPHPSATTVAAQAAAAHRTALALSRWCGGDTAADMRMAAALHPGPQAQWHAALQRQFCAWLEAGGFAAQERQRPTPRTDAPMKTAALRRCSQPHCGTIDEELKFSLLRIRDAVE